MATATELLNIVVNLKGGQKAASEAKGVEGAILKIAKAGTIVAGVFGAWQGVMAGVNFNSTMEQNQIAFEKFTGSVKLANGEIDALRALSNELPSFGFDTFATNAKKLLALGDPLSRVNKDLKVIGETALGLGLGSEGVDRLVLALGQMRSTGVVQGDELRQLQEAGIKVYDYLIKAGVITKKDIGQIGNLHLDAATAIDAIMNGMQRDFGGLASRARNTWAFQLGALKNQAAQASGALVKPIQDFATSDVLPKMTKAFRGIAHNAGNITGGLALTLKVLSPLIGAMVLYKGALMGVAAAEWAVAAGATAMAFASTLAAALALVPAITSVADAMYLLDAAFAANPVGIVIAAVAALIALVVYLYFKWDWFHRAVDNTWDAIVVGAKWAGRAMVNTFEWVVTAVKDVINFLLKAWNGLNFKVPSLDLGPLGKVHGFSIGVGHIPLLANGGNVPVGGRAIVGDAGPEMLENRGGSAVVTPLGAGQGAARMLQPVQVQIEGRTLMDIIVDIGQTAAARA